jgi:hypothetical protein
MFVAKTTTFIVTETFKTQNTNDRKRTLEKILTNIILKSSNLNTLPTED